MTVTAIVATVALAAGLFRGAFTDTVPVTLLSQRAGLVMYPDAKVEMLGVQVGRVSSIEEIPDGRAAIHLAINPSELHLIPSNVVADVSATTVFGAKYVQLVPPDDPSPEVLRSGEVLDAQHVTVEINTVFSHLRSVLAKLEPEKLNEEIGAIASAFDGRGKKIGQGLSDLDSFLTKIEPHLPTLSHELGAAPRILTTYADSAASLMKIVDDGATISQTIVDEQQSLDGLLLSVIGMANTGKQVLGQNTQSLTDVLHLLVPTTDLTRRYNEALYCGIAGLLPLANAKPARDPGLPVVAGLVWGADRYRYPGDLPKVAASGGPQCTGLPNLPFETSPPFVITDTGTNPWKYGNQGVVLNADGIKRLLFGNIDGPPRNVGQVGQPG